MTRAADLLEQLLDAWKHSRHPRVGDAVDGLTQHLLTEQPRLALQATKKQADLAAWSTLERRREALDFPRLMAAARGGQQLDVQRQVSALARWKDPRFAAGLLQFLERPPYAGLRSRPLLTTLLSLLTASDDSRAAAPCRALAARYLGIVDSSTGAFVVAGLLGVAAKLEAVEVAPLPSSLATLCLAAEQFAPRTAGSPRSVEDFEARVRRSLELVFQSPDDDQPRAVLADMLLEAGDARGEFIHAQLTGRVVSPALFTNPAVATWTQPLRLAGACSFARGFPEAVDVYVTAPKSRDEPLWRTVRRLAGVHKLSVKGAVALLDAPALANVKSVATLSVKQLAALGPRSRSWTSLALERLTAPESNVLAPFPALEDLSLRVEGPVPATLFTAVPGLRRLKLRAEGALPGHTPADLLAGLLKLESLELTVRGRVEQLRLPPSLERAELFGALPQVRLEGTRLRRLRCNTSMLQGTAVPTLDSLELYVDQHHARSLVGLERVEHLTLVADPGVLDPKLLEPLRRLRSLRVHGAALRGHHLATLAALQHLSGFPVAAFDELPAVPSLVSFECMAPRSLESLRAMLGRNPQLEFLDLQWNSACPLYFSAFGSLSDALPAWEALRTILEPSGVRVFRFHAEAALSRDERGRWSVSLLRAGNDLPSDDASRLVDALQPVFPLA